MTPRPPDRLPDRHEDDGHDVLGQVLQSVGRHLDTGVAGAGGTEATCGSARRPTGVVRRGLAIAASIIMLATAAVIVAPTRRAVGGWFGVGPVAVRLDPRLDVAGVDTLAPVLDESQLVAVDPDRAADVFGGPVPAIDGTSLGPPQQWWEPPEGGLLVSWDGGVTTLWLLAVNADVSDYLFKFVPEASEVTELADLGDGGVAIGGDHLLRTPRRYTWASNVVVWSAVGVVWRLESVGDVADIDGVIRWAGEFTRP